MSYQFRGNSGQHRGNRAPPAEMVEMRGNVTGAQEDGSYTVALSNGLQITASLAGAMRRFGVVVSVGDKVTVEMPEGQPSRSRITFRHLA